MSHGPPTEGGYMTLAYCIKNDVKIFAICKSCGRSAPMDRQALVARLGPDFKPGDDLKRFGAALRCSDCAQKGADVEFRSGVGGWDGSGAHQGNRAPD